MIRVIRFTMILFLTALSFSCTVDKANKPKKTDLEIYNLKGKIRSVREIQYDVQKKHGKIQKVGPGSKMLDIFNNKGFLLEDIGYDQNTDTIIYKYTYDYADNQQLIMENSYNAFGKSFSRYKYNNNGNKIEMLEFKSDNVLIKKIIYKYDWNGNKVEVLEYNSDGNLEEKNIYKYDKNGNVTKQLKYNSTGVLQYSDIYDSNGNLIERIGWSSKGKLSTKYTYKYNWNGDKVAYEFYDAMLNILRQYSYKYEYDEHGNWTRCIEYYNENNKSYVMYVSERKIVYY